MFTRKLGRSGLEVSALGMGCWAIGGQWWYVGDGELDACGWGQVDDKESIRALQVALDMGVNFFDTADVYGCGHSERILGQAFAGQRDQVVIATKFGKQFDEKERHFFGHETSPALVRSACEASLRRLNTDYIDLYQFHWGDYEAEKAAEVREVLEELVDEGKIRYYGWSTDEPERVRVFAEGEYCTAVQNYLSVFYEYPEVLAVCDELDLACINKQPLAMGILTGKFDSDTIFPEDDIRNGWNLKEDRFASRLKQVEAIREILTGDGRTLAQGALAWVWARSSRTLPIPGFKTVAQVKENAGAMEFGPLGETEMRQIGEILSRWDNQR